LPVVSLILVLICHSINDISNTSGKFTAGVIDTGGKFATGLVNINGAP
jgi:hypothetical protein